MRTLHNFFKIGERFLSLKGIEDSSLSSQRLLEKVARKNRASILLDKQLSLNSRERSTFFHLLRKRARYFPLQYLTGEVGFRNLELTIKEGVLIPRPETELLIDELHLLVGENEKFNALDIGTGCGNLALAIAQEFPNAEVTALDKSANALQLARENAKKYSLERRIQFVKSNLFEDLPQTTQFQVILSNPPYVPDAEKSRLQKEVAFEPEEALLGGQTGMELIDDILREGQNYLFPLGYLLLEIGFGQGDEVKKKAQQYGYGIIKIRKDYSGIDRIVVLQK